MASGKTHDKITYLTIPLVMFIQIFLVKDFQLVFLNTLIYVFAALMFSGDLDIKSVQVNRWGVFKFIWWPYRKFFNHRSSFTHGIIDATIIRIIYLISWIYLFLSVLHMIYPETVISGNEFIKWIVTSAKEDTFLFLNILGSLLLGGLSHTLTDYIYSTLKRKFTFRRKK
ncbi:metal-binding protein [Alkaliphilus sp. B6464]|uniref:metal-binding protein n=1 Tax=Alkaliphilus sp. B6464 TaxID=2731219 RepID=UPI001BA759AA|nr:metal-binding protein [Alkaliphilus sp. B6464]QUH22161.1 metal-binding protein [Alkaliphilus sp. B6464]